MGFCVGRRTRSVTGSQASHKGYPFLSSTDILQADLSNISYIAKSVARQNNQLLIKDRWTLITRSGTIGRMTYARAEMRGMACSEDVLRVVPDQDKVLPGYIYAYLCSKYGVPLVISGTYGSIITHLEPSHIADLPVPRLGKIEDQAHELIQQAADLRTNASTVLKGAAHSITVHLPCGAGCGYRRRQQSAYGRVGPQVHRPALSSDSSLRASQFRHQEAR